MLNAWCYGYIEIALSLGIGIFTDIGENAVCQLGELNIHQENNVLDGDGCPDL